MSVGLEYVSGIGAFRMNWYRGVSGERSLDGATRMENVSNGSSVISLTATAA